jgi:hypothetical protein
MSWIYKKVPHESSLWTVGHYHGGAFVPESDHDNPDSAAARCHWLNGGNAPEPRAETESYLCCPSCGDGEPSVTCSVAVEVLGLSQGEPVLGNALTDPVYAPGAIAVCRECEHAAPFYNFIYKRRKGAGGG